jgi:hypothetical protein
MMGEGAFILLKAPAEPPESTKQAEIALAWFAKILSICRPGRPTNPGEGRWQSSARALKSPVPVELAPISAGYG